MEFRKWIEQATDGFDINMSDFSAQEMEAFQAMRRAYKADDHMTDEYRRLAFVRWLVTEGKLTDQIKEETR